MSEERKQYVKGVAAGAAFVVAAVLVSWAAASDTSPVSWVAPYAFLSAVFWWIAVVLGVAAAISVADRLSAGVIVGALAIPAYVLSVALTRTPAERLAAFGETSFWLIAVLTLVVPWGIGLAFGWSVVEHRAEGRSRRF